VAREIINPYTAGPPLHRGDIFYGRDEVFASIRRRLKGRYQDNPVFLYGQRRIGKTSILLQIRNENRLGLGYLPVYINLQGMRLTVQGKDSVVRGMKVLLCDIAGEICQTMGIDKPKLDEFAENPQTYFRHTFLSTVFNSTGNKQLLLLFDEYETFGEKIKAGALEEDIFPFLRDLMAGEPNLSFIFAGSHTPGELGEHYTTTFGRTLLVKGIKVNFLQEDKATKLITEPAAELMHYDDEAVEMIFQLTYGHPFFIQLLCHNLFNLHDLAMNDMQEDEHVQITRGDVEGIIEETIASGENQFQEIWNEYFDLKEQVILAGASVALSSVEDREALVPNVCEADIDKALRLFSSRFEEGEIKHILGVLAGEKDALELDTRSSQYRFTVDLLRRWISRSQALRELASGLPIVVEEPTTQKKRGLFRRTLATRPITVIVVTSLFLAILCGTSGGFRGWWLPPATRFPLTAEVTPTPIATSTLSPIPTRTPETILVPTEPPPSTPAPTHTPETPTPTRTPTNTPTPTYTPEPPTNTPTSMPTPRPAQPTLVVPVQGGQYRNPITFQWSGQLRAGQAYRVTAYHPGSDYKILSEFLTAQDWTTDLPGERYGEWGWRVSVVRDGRELVTSSDGMFWFVPFGSGGSGPDATPTDPIHR